MSANLSTVTFFIAMSTILSLKYEADDGSIKILEELFTAYELAIFENIVQCILDCQSMSNDPISGIKLILKNNMSKDCCKTARFLFALLAALNEYTNIGEHFKYQTMDDFLLEYKVFANHDSAEQVKLFKIANWMNILINFLPAKFNKGIILAVVTKFVEGYQVNYITGKGQKPSVDDRVYIYEKEGKVQKLKRNRLPKVKSIVKASRCRKHRRHGQPITELFPISRSFTDGWNIALQHDNYTDIEDIQDAEGPDEQETTLSHHGDAHVMQDVHDEDMPHLVGDVSDWDEEEFLAMLDYLTDLPEDVSHQLVIQDPQALPPTTASSNRDGLDNPDMQIVLAMVEDMPDFADGISDALNYNGVLETNPGYYAG